MSPNATSYDVRVSFITFFSGHMTPVRSARGAAPKIVGSAELTGSRIHKVVISYDLLCRFLYGKAKLLDNGLRMMLLLWIRDVESEPFTYIEFDHLLCMGLREYFSYQVVSIT